MKNSKSDGDYHLVLTGDTLSYTDESANPPVPPTGHSFIGEVPDPSCFSGSDGSDRNEAQHFPSKVLGYLPAFHTAQIAEERPDTRTRTHKSSRARGMVHAGRKRHEHKPSETRVTLSGSRGIVQRAI